MLLLSFPAAPLFLLLAKPKITKFRVKQTKYLNSIRCLSLCTKLASKEWGNFY